MATLVIATNAAEGSSIYVALYSGTDVPCQLLQDSIHLLNQCSAYDILVMIVVYT